MIYPNPRLLLGFSINATLKAKFNSNHNGKTIPNPNNKT